MDNNFQTSFIPKKALAEERIPIQRHTSIFSFLATLVFFGSLASAAGMYFYRSTIDKEMESKKASLLAARDAFEPAFITELKVLDRRITDSNELLTNHIVVTPIFKVLEKNTLKSIQYTKFSYSVPSNPGSQVEVHMTGRARDYTSIALESDLLSTNKNIKDPIFSNLTLDEQSGTVTFDLVFNIDKNLVSYANHLTEFSTSSSQISDDSSSQNNSGVGSNTSSNGENGNQLDQQLPGQ